MPRVVEGRLDFSDDDDIAKTMNGQHSTKKKFHSVEIADSLAILEGQAVFQDNDDVDRICLQVNNLGTAGTCIRSAATPNGDGYFIATVIGQQSWAFGTEQSTKNFVLADSGSLASNQRLTVQEGGKTTITIDEAAFAPALTLENDDAGDLALEIHGQGSQADAVVFCHTDSTEWTFGAREVNSSFSICQSNIFNSNFDRFTLLENGNLGLGDSNPAYQLELSSDSAGKPSTSVWSIVSDRRLKEDITPADLQICYDNIKNLELKRFKWKDRYLAETGIQDRHRCGFIAQDVEQVYRKSVNTHTYPEDTPRHGLTELKDLNMSNHNMSLFGAVQMLMAKMDLLEAKIARLEAA